MMKISVWLVFLSALSFSPPAPAFSSTPLETQKFTALDHHFTLNDGLALDSWLSEIKNKEAADEQNRSQILGHFNLTELPYTSLKAYFDESCDYSSEIKNGVKFLQKISKQLTLNDTAVDTEHLKALTEETVQAIAGACVPPFPVRAELVHVPFVLYKYSHFTVGKGQSPASNLQGTADDLSLREPLPSDFWQRPAKISDLDLFTGYGREKVPHFNFKTCTYAAPKTSYGTNAGFKVSCDGKTIKVKLGESFSEPIASRLFWALGYSSAISDSVPEVELPYSRRILREFNMRKPIKTKITLMKFQKLKTYEISPVYDPFKFIKFAVLRDGSRLTSSEFRKILFYDSQKKHPERDAANFNGTQEQRVAYIVFRNASLKYGGGDEKKSLGSWSYNEFHHDDLRELRGFGLLAAWLGYADARAQNTHLTGLSDNGHLKLVHEISDSGDGLGKIAGVLGRDNGNKANEFTWRFTKPHVSGQGVEFTNFRTVDRNDAFIKMTIDDARWMARLIAQLSADQIEAALIAGGLNSAEVKLFLAKLESRRNYMMRDLGLEKEAPPLTTKIGAELQYDPVTAGAMTAVLPNGTKVTAPVGEARVENGVLVGPYTKD